MLKKHPVFQLCSIL